jgi:hypothetical protein
MLAYPPTETTTLGRISASNVRADRTARHIIGTIRTFRTNARGLKPRWSPSTRRKVCGYGDPGNMLYSAPRSEPMK